MLKLQNKEVYNITDTHIQNVHFIDCDFSETVLSNTTFENCTFEHCRMNFDFTQDTHKFLNNTYKDCFSAYSEEFLKSRGIFVNANLDEFEELTNEYLDNLVEYDYEEETK